MKVPKNHKVWVTICETYIITTKENDRSKYFLYKIDNNKLEKIGENRNPLELEKKYIKFRKGKSD